MQAASGLVTALNLVLSLVVGLRLLRQSGGRWRAPELHLATYFLVSSFLSTVLQVPAYGSLVDPRLAAFVPLQAAFLAGAVLCLQVGTSGVYLFVWRTFRPDRRWARNLAILGIATMFLGYAVEVVFEGFAIRIVAGPGHVIGCLGRIFAFAWAAWEALAYYVRMRRRERLGLADPVLANRFLLWGVWAVTGVSLFASDLLARVAYLMTAGTTDVVMSVLEPTVRITIGATMAASVVSATTLFLTFFPTRGYRRWVESRATVPSA